MKGCIYLLVFLFSISCQRNEGKIDLQQHFQELNEKGLFNGAIIVIDNDSLVLSRGFGYANFELKSPFETSTAMDTGSITKNFTALAMLMLADSNEIDLNSPVYLYLKEFPYKSITIRHLLEQTSGIVSDDYVFDRAQKDVPLSNGVFLDFLVKDEPELEFTPGIQFMYNGFNHRLLAMIIENISGATYEEFINKSIAKPLDLENWFLRPARLKDLPGDRALGYSMEGTSFETYDSDDFEAFYGDCNLFFSAEDLSKWSRSFISNSLYSDLRLKKALRTKSALSEFNILHWYNLTDQSKYHFTGDWKGFYTMVYFDVDKKRSIVYLSNTNLAYWLRPGIVRRINHYLDDGAISSWRHPEPIELSSDEIAGSYYLNESEIALISYNNGILRIDKNDKNVELFKLDSNYYYAPGIDLWIWFSKDNEEGINIYCSSIYELKRGKKTADNAFNKN